MLACALIGIGFGLISNAMVALNQHVGGGHHGLQSPITLLSAF